MKKRIWFTVLIAIALVIIMIIGFLGYLIWSAQSTYEKRDMLREVLTGSTWYCEALDMQIYLEMDNSAITANCSTDPQTYTLHIDYGNNFLIETDGSGTAKRIGSFGGISTDKTVMSVYIHEIATEGKYEFVVVTAK